jgi:uncharacterized Zn finger protein
MPTFTRTWWGQRFIEELEKFTDAGRLGRGRTYASTGRIISHQLEGGRVKAKVRGSINPYFGVYKEPTYNTTLRLEPISTAAWTKIIADVSAKAGYVAKLLLNEMPDTIEDAFAPYQLHLLPRSRSEFTTSCSCPDYGNPCKHVAGLCYVVAADLDRDPFLLFELRGLSRQQLHAELARSPLGQILASELTPPDVIPEPAAAFFTRPERKAAPGDVSLKEFWTGAKRLPPIETSTGPAVPALLIKKGGDNPPFWKKETSFLDVMEGLYERVRTKSPAMK